MRFTPPRRARRRMAGLVMPLMLSRRILRWRLAPPFPNPFAPSSKARGQTGRENEKTTTTTKPRPAQPPRSHSQTKWSAPLAPNTASKGRNKNNPTHNPTHNAQPGAAANRQPRATKGTQRKAPQHEMHNKVGLGGQPPQTGSGAAHLLPRPDMFEMTLFGS